MRNELNFDFDRQDLFASMDSIASTYSSQITAFQSEYDKL